MPPFSIIDRRCQWCNPNPIGSFLKDAQLFDNVEFGVSAKDAIAMTASSRRMIELSFLALLDSGIDYRGRKVGSFAAGTNAEAVAHVRHLETLF
jgi:acyl transferase domain-containing protein